MSDIIVKFKPMGHKKLIDAINRLQDAQGKATKGGRKFTRNVRKDVRRARKGKPIKKRKKVKSFANLDPLK